MSDLRKIHGLRIPQRRIEDHLRVIPSVKQTGSQKPLGDSSPRELKRNATSNAELSRGSLVSNDVGNKHR